MCEIGPTSISVAQSNMSHSVVKEPLEAGFGLPLFLQPSLLRFCFLREVRPCLMSLRAMHVAVFGFFFRPSLLLCSTLKLPRLWQAFAETPWTTWQSILQAFTSMLPMLLVISGLPFCLLQASACLIQQLQDLDMAYLTRRPAALCFSCNMLQFSMPTWPCLVAKLCGVAPKEFAWDGLARNSKSIRQIERS